MYLSEFVALMGSPNVGKSTLLNAFVGQKVAIVTKKPQTTRTRIVGVYTTDEYQMVFVDTPGIHEPHDKLSEFMVRTAQTAARDVDVVLFVADARIGIGDRDRKILESMPKDAPVLIAVNKIDAVSRERVDEVVENAGSYGYPVMQISAKENIGVAELRDRLREYLRPGPMFYPENVITDQPERVIASEIIREKAFTSIGKEIPYGLGIEIEQFYQEKHRDLYHIEAAIYCEKQSHKQIIIGAKGAKLKKIGSAARADLEQLLGAKVFLRLWVKVKSDWRNKASVLRTLGYYGE